MSDASHVQMQRRIAHCRGSGFYAARAVWIARQAQPCHCDMQNFSWKVFGRQMEEEEEEGQDDEDEDEDEEEADDEDDDSGDGNDAIALPADGDGIYPNLCAL